MRTAPRFTRIAAYPSGSPGKPWPIGRDHRSFSSIDLLIMDREEALKISGENSLDKALFYFSRSPLKAFMVTDGTQPVSIYSNTVKSGVSGHNKPFRLPVSSALLGKSLKGELNADTTGAGDNFVGGVIKKKLPNALNILDR